MRTYGVDLAAEPGDTGHCVIRWESKHAVVEALSVGVGDADIVAGVRAADVTAIDAPFGWPDTFVRAVSQHHAGSAWPYTTWSPEIRRNLRLRTTDRFVYDETRLTPLSVSADSIAIPAMRCAGILATLGVVDRSSTGTLVEAYPAASLKRWGLRHNGYKEAKGRERRVEMLAELGERAPWLALAASHSELCARTDDALDALLCGLIARAAQLGLASRPPDGLRALAAVEGWIALPNEDSLSRLLG